MTLFLIGYMASGKTTLGRAFARATGMQFIDLDFYIEQRFRKSISQIFAEEGEERFREIEREMLHEAGEFCDAVISCGGGTPCFFDNMDFMNERGTTVWLRASVDRTVHRLLEAKTRRPIVERIPREELSDFIATHLNERIPYYSKARIEFDSNELEFRRQIDEQVNRLRSLLETLQS
ncbi:MAG: shikimate kinase [Bacteroides sp.]|nr:shikimate kinase [Bacteroides sp.]